MALDLAADAKVMIDNAPDPETVVYRPTGGAARTITAIVDREQPDIFEDTQAPVPIIRISVVNSATDGISAAELDIGQDQIDVAIRQGDTAETREIGALLAQDAGMLRIEVR